MSVRHRLIAFAVLLAAAGFVTAIGAWHRWNWQAAYLAALAWAFVFWNSVRILTYVPTLRLLLRPGASAVHYSVATWSSWVLSNGTLALYLFEASGRRLNSLVLLNAGNALMCLVTCALIVRLRWRGTRAAPAPADQRARAVVTALRPRGTRRAAPIDGLRIHAGRSR